MGIFVAALVVIIWPSLTVGFVLVAAIVLVVCLLVLEVFRAGPEMPGPTAVNASDEGHDG